MSPSNLEQIKDLKGTNFELDLGEPLPEQDVQTPKMSDEDDDPFIVRRTSTKLFEPLLIPFFYEVSDYISDLLSPIGLKRLVMSIPALLKRRVDSLQQPSIWLCPKYGLIILLYQKARAPP
jgi:hypothetical protein